MKLMHLDFGIKVSWWHSVSTYCKIMHCRCPLTKKNKMILNCINLSKIWRNTLVFSGRGGYTGFFTFPQCIPINLIIPKEVGYQIWSRWKVLYSNVFLPLLLNHELRYYVFSVPFLYQILFLKTCVKQVI